MRANNALGIDDIEVRGPEDGARGMKPKMGALTSTGGSGSDPSSQPTLSGHDLPAGKPAPRPGGPSKATIVNAKPPAPAPPATTKPVKAGRPAKPPTRGGRRA
jgi:hypothetical protein